MRVNDGHVSEPVGRNDTQQDADDSLHRSQVGPFLVGPRNRRSRVGRQSQPLWRGTWPEYIDQPKGPSRSHVEPAMEKRSRARKLLVDQEYTLGCK